METPLSMRDLFELDFVVSYLYDTVRAEDVIFVVGIAPAEFRTDCICQRNASRATTGDTVTRCRNQAVSSAAVSFSAIGRRALWVTVVMT